MVVTRYDKRHSANEASPGMYLSFEQFKAAYPQRFPELLGEACPDLNARDTLADCVAVKVRRASSSHR